jgi:serine/threonine protein kinase
MHRKECRTVALKIYEKEKIKDIQRQKSVRREIRLMKRLDHPHIAKLYDAIETEDQVILVLEYVPGGSTHGFLKSKKHRRMSEDDARRIYRQIINALTYLHGKCIAHRDIKLENVMLDDTQSNQVKLIDFGFSTCIPNEQRIRIFCGTPSYMAPEIVKKTEFCGPPTDIYAAGVLLFAFFCGQFPYKGGNDKELYQKIIAGELKIPEYVPIGPRRIIERSLLVCPEDRPTSAQLWADPWLQNYNVTCDSSLVSYSSRQSYTNRPQQAFANSHRNVPPNAPRQHRQTSKDPEDK